MRLVLPIFAPDIAFMCFLVFVFWLVLTIFKWENRHQQWSNWRISNFMIALKGVAFKPFPAELAPCNVCAREHVHGNRGKKPRHGKQANSERF